MIEGLTTFIKRNKLSFLVFKPSALVPTAIRFLYTPSVLDFVLFPYPRRVFSEQDFVVFDVDLLASLHSEGVAEGNSKDVCNLVFARGLSEMASCVLKKIHLVGSATKLV